MIFCKSHLILFLPSILYQNPCAVKRILLEYCKKSYLYVKESFSAMYGV